MCTACTPVSRKYFVDKYRSTLRAKIMAITRIFFSATNDAHFVPPRSSPSSRVMSKVQVGNLPVGRNGVSKTVYNALNCSLAMQEFGKTGKSLARAVQARVLRSGAI